MSLFFDYTLDGIANGMVYATLALALVLIYRATRIINFAQGAAGMLTTFIAFSLLSRGVGYWWAFVLVLVIGFAIGAVTEPVLFEWTETADRPEFKAISELIKTMNRPQPR